MRIKEIARQSLDRLLELGIDKASVQVSRDCQSEMQKEFNGIDLFRDVDTINVEYRVINDDREGIHRFTFSSNEDIKLNVEKVIKLASESNPDKAHGMAPNSTYKNNFGIDKPDYDGMYNLLSKFEVEKEQQFPQITETTSIAFYNQDIVYLNNLGSEIEYSNGCYLVFTKFSASHKGKHSSMDYFAFPFTEFPMSLLQLEIFQQKYKDAIQQTQQKPFTGKFTSEVIINPTTFRSLFIGLRGEMQGQSLIDKTSLFQDKLNQKVFNDKLTIKAVSEYPEFVNKYIHNNEGYLNKDGYIVEKGVLKNFNIIEYVANKTDFMLNPLPFGNLIVDGGDIPFNKMVKSVKKGLLINRLSFGAPNKNKDFSGVAKNSYYIENGQIKYPVSEVMISGNLLEMFNNIEEISCERENVSGAVIAPWMKISGVNISGK